MNEQQFQKNQADYGDEYLLRQLAEECIELAHASLKLIRAMRGETPLPIEKARAGPMSILWTKKVEILC